MTCARDFGKFEVASDAWGFQSGNRFRDALDEPEGWHAQGDFMTESRCDFLVQRVQHSW